MTGRLCLLSVCIACAAIMVSQMSTELYRCPVWCKKVVSEIPICESTGRLIFIFFKNSDNRVRNSLGQIAGRSVMKSPSP